MSRFCGVLLVVLAALWPAMALAEKRVALVFSAGGYKLLRPLDNPGNDAGKVGEALEKLGFEVFSENDRDLRRMRRALDDFREDAKGADVALVYFAGHGVEIGGQNYLLPVDADPASLETLQASALPLNEVRDVAASVSRSVLLVLDACRNDPFGSETTGGRSMKPFGSQPKPDSVKPGLGRIGNAENTLFAFSAAPGQTAADGDGGNSPFSAALANYFGTDGLEIRSVLTLVQQEVYEQSGGKQLPYVESGLPALFFASQTGPLPERETLLLAMADVTPDMRAEVERTAAANSMPLAPLYGALISADLKAMTLEDRDKKLTEAAQAFVKIRNDLKLLSSSDPEVTRLRGEAETALGLGAFAKARNLLEQAANIDAVSGNILGRVFIAKQLGLAETLQLVAGVAMVQLDYDGAIAAYERAATVHEQIEKLDVPDEERRERTWLLADLGDLQVQAGNPTAARMVFERMEMAANARLTHAAGNLDGQRDLSASQLRIGDVRQKLGDFSGALTTYQNGLTISERIAAQDPGDATWQLELPVYLDRIGDVHRKLHDLPGALKTYQDSLNIRVKLLAQGHVSIDWKRDLSANLLRMGDVSSDLDDLTGALKAYQHGLTILQELVEQNPGNADLQHNLSATFDRIGNVQVAQRDLPSALKAYQDGLAIREHFAAKYPGVVEWQHGLSISIGNIGDVRRSQDDMAGALKAYQDSLAILEKLAILAPGNAEWQHDLSASFNKIGDLRESQDDLTGALNAYQGGLAVRERLAAQDPDNAEWQHDLSVSFDNIGDVRRKQGDLPGALTAYQDSLIITEKLAAQDPGNAKWQRVLVVIYFKIGILGHEPRASFARAQQITEAIQARGTLLPTDVRMLELLREALADLQ